MKNSGDIVGVLVSFVWFREDFCLLRGRDFGVG